jgi:hypothetical protein
VGKLKKFFSKIEPLLTDDADLKSIHTDLFALFNGSEDERFEKMPKGTICVMEISARFGSASIWGHSDSRRQRNVCSTLAQHVTATTQLHNAFQEIGVPEDWVTMNIGFLAF